MTEHNFLVKENQVIQEIHRHSDWTESSWPELTLDHACFPTNFSYLLSTHSSWWIFSLRYKFRQVKLWWIVLDSPKLPKFSPTTILHYIWNIYMYYHNNINNNIYVCQGKWRKNYWWQKLRYTCIVDAYIDQWWVTLLYCSTNLVK